MRRLLALILAPAAVLAVGCGSSNKPPSASGGSNAQKPIQAAYKYSACMRQHGVPDFPDPKIVNHNGEHGVGIAVGASDASSPAFKSAETACQGIMPAGGPGPPSVNQQHARAAGLVSFARCMRAHGVNSFPDPTPQGQINPQMLSSAGINIHSPAVLQDVYACVPSSKGQLTRADIAQAESGG